MSLKNNDFLVITLPSKGSLEKSTLEFMDKSGLKVHRPNKRQYEANIEGHEQIRVLFQKADDIPDKVREGSADLGITGLDLQKECQVEEDKVIVIAENLGYGKCELMLAVSDDQIDITSVSDLADLSVAWHEHNNNLRVATRFPNLTRVFLGSHGVRYFILVQSHGALEMAPRMGYADVISDIVETGTTLRENRLKTIKNGTILSSSACLIANKDNLKESDEKLRMAGIVIEALESSIRAKRFFSVVANIGGENEKKIFESIMKDAEVVGMKGPTISKVLRSQEKDFKEWFAINVVIEEKNLSKTVEHIRKKGGTDILVFPIEYIFNSKSEWYEELKEELKKK